MSETITEPEATEQEPVEAPEEEVEQSEKVEGEEALGDPGKKALDTMKAERNTAREEAKKAREEAEALKAQIEGREAEYKAEQEKRAAEQAALAKADERILKAEVRAAAAGKLSDPADALRFIDLSSFEVGDDGEVDASAITGAITDLIEAKPYLAAQSGKRFQGSADGGARNESLKPSQLTREDVKRLSDEGRHEEIVKAKSEGRLADYLASS